MSLFFYYGAGDFGNEAIRLGEGFSFTECADSGVLAMSRVMVDDPTGVLDIVGHHSFRATETSCSWDSLFRGYFADRTIKRYVSMLTGAARIWDGTVYDLNAAMDFEVIRGTTAIRPKETDTARLAWLLASGYTGPISTNGASVFGAGVNLDKADYRGRYMSDVVNDCAQVSGCNYFVAWEDALGSAALHYYLPTRAFNTSTLKISNVLADVDGATVYAPSSDASLNRDPGRVYSGVYYQYGEKTSAEYRTDAGVLAAIGHKRETTEQDQSVRTAAKADAKADKWLAEAATELDTISVTLHKVRPADVNLIRAGQRIQVKFTHLPGFTSYTYMRITRRTVEQDGDTQEYYKLDLELANPKQGGTKRGPRNAPASDMEDGSSLSYTRGCLSANRNVISYSGGTANVPIPDVVAFGTPVPPAHDEVTECSPSFRRPYTFADCPPTFQGGWSGTLREEQYLIVTVGSLSGVATVRVTFTVSLPLFTTGKQLEYGVRTPDPTVVPTAEFQYQVLGYCDPAGGYFDIPASVLTASATNYIVIAPADLSARGIETCDDSLLNGLEGPLGGISPGGGEYNSWQVQLNITSIYTRTVSGSGLTPWQSFTETVNGTRKTFTAPDWNGSGVPGVRIGAEEYAAGADYSYDPAAGTVTLNFAPWSGAPLQGRWHA